ncbi:MAG: GNAT family N-acetyltransferase [Kofleriaceae bacterium]
MRIESLDRGHLAVARELLGRSCAFDRADDVADEKLFGAGPSSTARAIGAFDGNDLIGLAATAGRHLRVLAVAPEARDHGVGTALLRDCETTVLAAEPRIRALDQPGNYLAPGIDERNIDTIAWLERRGWIRETEPRLNVLIAVRDNPRVTRERTDELAHKCRANGYEIRRAHPDEAELLAAVAKEFGGAWPFELARALGHTFDLAPAEETTRLTNAPESITSTNDALGSGVHVALKDGVYCAFAAHDGNNRGLGWFGPTGTWPDHRGNRLGEALLLACLVDVADFHDHCEVAWIGPRPFYEKVASIAMDRRFVAMKRER